jgi:hypothetical protein
MCQAKDAADKPCGKRPARTCEKSPQAQTTINSTLTFVGI